LLANPHPIHIGNEHADNFFVIIIYGHRNIGNKRIAGSFIDIGFTAKLFALHSVYEPLLLRTGRSRAVQKLNNAFFIGYIQRAYSCVELTFLSKHLHFFHIGNLPPRGAAWIYIQLYNIFSSHHLLNQES